MRFDVDWETGDVRMRLVDGSFDENAEEERRWRAGQNRGIEYAVKAYWPKAE